MGCRFVRRRRRRGTRLPGRRTVGRGPCRTADRRSRAGRRWCTRQGRGRWTGGSRLARPGLSDATRSCCLGQGRAREWFTRVRFSRGSILPPPGTPPARWRRRCRLGRVPGDRLRQAGTETRSFDWLLRSAARIFFASSAQQRLDGPMSSVHRPAGFLLSALFALGLAACGDNNAAPGADDGDDDGGGGATLPDASGGEPDSGGGQPDGGGGDKDAGDRPDAGDVDGGSDRDAGDVPDAGDLMAAVHPMPATPMPGRPMPESRTLARIRSMASSCSALRVERPSTRTIRIRFITTVDFTATDGDAGGTADFSFQPIVADDCVGGHGRVARRCADAVERRPVRCRRQRSRCPQPAPFPRTRTPSRAACRNSRRRDRGDSGRSSAPGL